MAFNKPASRARPSTSHDVHQLRDEVETIAKELASLNKTVQTFDTHIKEILVYVEGLKSIGKWVKTTAFTIIATLITTGVVNGVWAKLLGDIIGQ